MGGDDGDFTMMIKPSTHYLSGESATGHSPRKVQASSITFSPCVTPACLLATPDLSLSLSGIVLENT